MRARIIRITGIVLPVVIACVLLALPAALSAAPAAQPYKSEMREQCEAEMAKDKAWQADLRQSCRADVHQEDANVLMTNKKHVVMAYAALWGLTVVFLVLLWLRQRRLVAEMDRLAAQIDKASAE